MDFLLQPAIASAYTPLADVPPPPSNVAGVPFTETTPDFLVALTAPVFDPVVMISVPAGGALAGSPLDTGTPDALPPNSFLVPVW